MTVPIFHHRVLCWVIVKPSSVPDTKMAAAILEARAYDNGNQTYASLPPILIHQGQINAATVHDELCEIEKIFAFESRSRKELESLLRTIDRITMARIIKRLWERNIQPCDQLGTIRVIRESLAIRDRVRSVFRCEETMKNADPIIE